MNRHADGSSGVDDQDSRLGGVSRQRLTEGLERVAARQLSPSTRMQLSVSGGRYVIRLYRVQFRLGQSPGQGCQVVEAGVRHDALHVGQ